MPDIDDTISRLMPILERVRHWRADAEVIRMLAAEAREAGDTNPQRLQQVEETASEIYRQIEDFDRTVAENRDDSPATLAMIGEAGDALRLVLLEITELGTSMYGARSTALLDAGAAG